MMKDLKTYLLEAIKPPRLSAKNRDLWSGPQFIKEEVMKWIKENCNIRGKVEIDDGNINVNGDVRVNEDIEEFRFPFGEVIGDFKCYGCKNLKSLKNSPQKVGGSFSCSNCESLTSLEDAPNEVRGYFSCSHCDNLTSIEGAPKEVGGDFWCQDCGKKFTEDDVRKVCRVRMTIYV